MAALYRLSLRPGESVSVDLRLSDTRVAAPFDQNFAASLRQLMQAAHDEGFELVPTSGMRDPWTQAKLWRQSRGRSEVDAKIASLRHDGASYLADILEAVGPQATVACHPDGRVHGLTIPPA